MMRKWIITFLALCFSITSFASNSKAIVLTINGIIGPATEDYVVKNIQLAQEKQAKLVILELNTPGGLETAMTAINNAILSATIPIITFVTPQGGSAASAGTYIIYASPLAAMAPGTRIGAATPVDMLGKNGANDLSTSEKKAINDSTAYLKALARLHKRNEIWAVHAVQDASSITAEEAKKLNVIEVIASDIPELLQKINHRVINLQGHFVTLDTSHLVVEKISPSWHYRFLTFLTHPNIIYLLLLIAIYGIFFELSSPGLILPGVAGTIALLLTLYALHLMPINYTGLTLILTGLTFMALEVYVSSYGVLGLGGIIAFIIGSLMLFEGQNPYYHLTVVLIFIMSIASLIFFYIILQLTIQAYKKNIITGKEGLIGCEGTVISIQNNKILVKVLGEIWEATSDQSLSVGQKIKVKSSRGLVLQIESF